jgi:hypothetical protein
MIPSVNAPRNFHFALKFSKNPPIFLWFVRDSNGKKSNQYTVRDALIYNALEFVFHRYC